ncbi:type II toxin-antitoxin system HipA family toxin [Sphingobium boeckii]|uniref:Serine/threonine-protein kinase HipA n=1 Tax=Sphingobium boeckii TaxID=1082345 RepID=A0A7W9EGV1_9SPHN|nr:type II toxin-antitoxin system HipA family toxin [Sphingobium boeckii]MBB5687485.1 serine/threonine-protein kinase HipA [Sphingobium boeckii]
MWLDESDNVQPVGRLAMARTRAQLEWSSEIIASGMPIAPALYPVERGLLEARSNDFDGLHGFLADSLPEGWGALVMKRRLAKLGFRWDDLNGVDRLALVGHRGRGALVYAPATTPNEDVQTLDLDELAAQSHSILLGEEASLADTLATLAGASGGARPKVHIGFSPDGKVCLAEDESGGSFESWIVKFRALADPVDIGPVEEAYARMARAAGITMATSRVLPAKEGSGYFATRRFDRPVPARRLHMVSLAGAIEAPSHMPSIDYDGFLRAVHGITRHAGDLEQAFRRMLFNILACNRDDHTRQHSFLLDADSEWRLAPAYDLTYSSGPGGEHYLAVAGEGRTPTRDHVLRLAKRHGFSEVAVSQMIDAVRASIADWPRHAEELAVSASLNEITARLAGIDKVFG